MPKSIKELQAELKAATAARDTLRAALEARSWELDEVLKAQPLFRPGDRVYCIRANELQCGDVTTVIWFESHAEYRVRMLDDDDAVVIDGDRLYRSPEELLANVQARFEDQAEIMGW